MMRPSSRGWGRDGLQLLLPLIPLLNFPTEIPSHPISGSARYCPGTHRERSGRPHSICSLFRQVLGLWAFFAHSCPHTSHRSHSSLGHRAPGNVARTGGPDRSGSVLTRCQGTSLHWDHPGRHGNGWTEVTGGCWSQSLSMRGVCPAFQGTPCTSQLGQR